ncbi:hypothetical protein CDAR_411511 [Caerostris darwini]|uniref:Gustatory receptor n=1 Tax=Caerostris darwini TaxID=1538125 RepID=A0AAV4SCQ7_9ARAC|nr:hypothetical protein CDAR_411511 [Caerostris darwini]
MSQDFEIRNELMWKVLAATGIDIQEKKRNESTARGAFRKSASCVLCGLSFLYSVLLLMKFGAISTKLIKSNVVSLINILLSFMLWIVVYKRKFLIHQTLVKLHLISVTLFHAKLPVFKHVKFTIFSIWLSLPVYCLITIIVVWRTNNDYLYLWTLDSKMDLNFLGVVVLLFCPTLFYLPVVIFPSFINTSLCMLYLNCSCLLTQYEAKLRLFKPGSLDIQFVTAYSTLIKITEEVNDVVSTPAFLCTAIFFSQMLTSLAWTFLTSGTRSAAHNLEIAYATTMSVLSAVSLPLVASNITIEARKIKVKLERLYENSLMDPAVNVQDIKIMQNAARKKNIEMSACHVLYFNRGYALALFGALFTYGLLFININA